MGCLGLFPQPPSCGYTQLEGLLDCTLEMASLHAWQCLHPLHVALHTASFSSSLRAPVHEGEGVQTPTASFCHTLLATASDQCGLETSPDSRPHGKGDCILYGRICGH